MTKPLKVLFLLKRMDLNDGVSSHLETLSEQLCDLGHTMSIVSGPITGQDKSPARFARLSELTTGITVTSKRSLAELLKKATKEIGAFRPDVIHAHGYSAALIGKILSMITFTPMVSTMHVIRDNRTGTKSFLKRVATKAFSSDRFICISSDLKKFLTDECWISERKIDFIPNGINEQLYRLPRDAERAAARSAFGLKEGQLVCVLPGRLDWSKGHAIAVAAVRSLAPEMDVVCLFPGTGHNAVEIQAQTHLSEDDVNRFKFLGQLPDLRSLFHAADILILPSSNEGFPLVVVEGMLSGCPPIRTPAGGAYDQIEDGENGFIVPFGDSVALADRIHQLSDSLLRAKMARNSYNKAIRNFTATVMADRTLSSYTHAITGR